MSKQIMGKHKWKKKVNRMWKGDLATRKLIRACRDATRPTQNFVKEVKDNGKAFFINYISSKRKTKENMGLQLNDIGALIMEDTEKAELNTFFASVLTAKTVPQESQTMEITERLAKEKLPFGRR